jgi:hypothetical protein
MKSIFCLLCLCIGTAAFTQQNDLPLHTFYKDAFLQQSGKRSIETFFPANENQLNLHELIRDSSKQYYDFTEWLFKKHWLTVDRPEGNLSISPLVDFTGGKELSDPSRGNIFRNTRGIFAEGELLHKIGFQFIFAENQARFMGYEAAYFNQQGERYVGTDGYSVQNAVIPGGARTKPFKTDAYDYAFSMGSIHYELNRHLNIDAGNTPLFVGTGYRSLLLSDNALGTPHVRVRWQVAPKWSYQVLFSKQQNLYRKPLTQAVESVYEAKLYGATYLTFQPIPNLSLSLFTAGSQLRGDSLVKHGLIAQMLVPVPLVQNDLLFGNSDLFNGITGLNVDFGLEHLRLYGQLVVDKYEKSFLFAGQLGVYFWEVLHVKNLSAQVEANIVPDHFYEAANPKLSYSHNNLPIAHPKGNNFNEALLRLNYEYKRMFVQSKSVLQDNSGGSLVTQFYPNSIFSDAVDNAYVHTGRGMTIIQEFELGYRFNRKYNAMLLVAWKVRHFEYPGQANTAQQLTIGLKTGLLNQYLDF